MDVSKLRVCKRRLPVTGIYTVGKYYFESDLSDIQFTTVFGSDFPES